MTCISCLCIVCSSSASLPPLHLPQAAVEKEAERRDRQAAARRDAAAVRAKQREEEVRLLLGAAAGASQAGGALSLEEQKRIISESRRAADQAVSQLLSTVAAAGAGSGSVPSAMRTASLGSDRDGTVFWCVPAAAALLLGGAPTLAGAAAEPTGALLAQRPAPHAASSAALAASGEGRWEHLQTPAEVAAALDPAGAREGPLQKRLCLRFRLPAGAAAGAATEAGAEATKKVEGRGRGTKEGDEESKGSKASSHTALREGGAPPAEGASPRKRSRGREGRGVLLLQQAAALRPQISSRQIGAPAKKAKTRELAALQN